jgi:hypothetical protein
LLEAHWLARLRDIGRPRIQATLPAERTERMLPGEASKRGALPDAATLGRQHHAPAIRRPSARDLAIFESYIVQACDQATFGRA